MATKAYLEAKGFVKALKARGAKVTARKSGDEYYDVFVEARADFAIAFLEKTVMAKIQARPPIPTGAALAAEVSQTIIRVFRDRGYGIPEDGYMQNKGLLVRVVGSYEVSKKGVAKQRMTVSFFTS